MTNNQLQETTSHYSSFFYFYTITIYDFIQKTCYKISKFY